MHSIIASRAQTAGTSMSYHDADTISLSWLKRRYGARDPTLDSHKQGNRSGIVAPSLFPATRFLI
jgi:hypothetical protein